MKQRIMKRVVVWCMVGVMSFVFVACGDSEKNNRGKNNIENQEETMEVVKNEETTDIDEPSNDNVSVVHTGLRDNGGNGSTMALFKPGDEPKDVDEPTLGEEPQASREPKSSTEQKPNKEPQQPKPNAESQQPQPSAEPQQSKPSAESQQPKPNTETKPTHTHSFQGGNCSTPSTCSCGATGDYGSHAWTTQTIHHDATGHNESRVTGTENVYVGRQRVSVYYCGQGNGHIYTDDQGQLHVEGGGCSFSTRDYNEFENHQNSTSHKSKIEQWVYEDVYETRDIVEDVWVVDSQAWDENITTCSICGSRQ